MITRSEVQRTEVRARVSGSGPYKTAGDVFTRSNGDWQDVLVHGAAFAAAPALAGDNPKDITLSLWVPRAAYVPNVNDFYPGEVFERAGLAAFAYWAFPEDTTFQGWALLVRDAILRQITVGGLTDGGNWTAAIHYYGVAQIGPWVIRVAQAYHDTKVLFTLKQQEAVERWLTRWANYMMGRQLGKWGQYLPNFGQGDLSVRRSFFSATGEASIKDASVRIYPKATDGYQTVDSQGYMLTHINADGTDGNRVSSSAILFDNPDDMQAHAIGFIGVVTGNVRFINHTCTYIRGKITFWAYGDGTNAEWHRNGRWLDGKTPNPGFGAHNYAPIGLQMMGHMAYLLGINGDMSLYTFSTRDGVHGSQCQAGQPDKSLQSQGVRLAKNVLGTDPLYWRKVDANNVIDHKSRYNLRTLDGVQWPYESPFDYVLGIINIGYNNATIKSAYLRTGVGGYGRNLASAGVADNYKWGGNVSSMVAFSLSYCQMEDKSLLIAPLAVEGEGASLALGKRSHVLTVDTMGNSGFAWSQVSGPPVDLIGTDSAYLIVNPRMAKTLAAGEYVFGLRVLSNALRPQQTVRFTVS